jgi:pyruvate dehydrogenase E1 component alpha subunit
VLFVCENNGFASTTRTAAVTAGPGPVARAESIGMAAASVDGNDVVAVDDVAAEAVRRIRAGGGPFFLEARTYRLRGHTAADAAPYRPAAEVEERWKSDPMTRAAETLARLGYGADKLKAIEDEAAKEMDEAIAVAKAAPWPEASTAFDDVQDVGAPR